MPFMPKEWHNDISTELTAEAMIDLELRVTGYADSLIGVIGGYATLVSPHFTGVPTAPTASIGTNTTQVATTAFVEAALGGVTGGYATVQDEGTPLTQRDTLNFKGPAVQATDNSPVTDVFVTNGPASVSVKTASYTLALADDGTTIEVDSAGSVTINIPTNASVGIRVNAVIEICRFNTGAVTIAAAGGVTLHSRGGLTSIGNQFGSVSLRKRAADDWIVTGDLA